MCVARCQAENYIIQYQGEVPLITEVAEVKTRFSWPGTQFLGLQTGTPPERGLRDSA